MMCPFLLKSEEHNSDDSFEGRDTSSKVSGLLEPFLSFPQKLLSFGAWSLGHDLSLSVYWMLLHWEESLHKAEVPPP